MALPGGNRMIDNADLLNRFTFHPATTEERQAEHQDVRMACLDLGDTLNAILPDGREKSVAFTKLEEVMFWSNAALARQP